MYKLFSQRKKEVLGEIPDVYEYEVFPESFRNQFLHIINNLFAKGNKNANLGYGYRERFDFWEITCELFAREKGLKYIQGRGGYNNTSTAYELYVDKSTNEDFLDLLDFTISRIVYHEQSINILGSESIEDAIEELNYRFQQHYLGYEIINGDLIPKTDEHIHTNIIKPALSVLHQKEFQGSENEFIVAWKHYKDRNYKDAILNAGKAFESVMKSICKHMKYPYNDQKDDAKKLIQILRDNEFFPTYLESHMNGIRATLESGAPTVRNKTSGHGQGELVVEVSEAYASYSLNLVATNIVFLCKLFQERRKSK